MQKKVPMRMCVGCRQMKPKRELLRIVCSRSTDEGFKSRNIVNESDDKCESAERESVKKAIKEPMPEKGTLVKIEIDRSGKKNGRGAYVCANRACFEHAVKSRALERTFSCRIDSSIFDTLAEIIEHTELEDVDNIDKK